MKTTPNLILLAFITVLLLTMINCYKERHLAPATLSTLTVSNITSNSAQSGGNITSDGGGYILSRGIVWSLLPNPTLEENNGLVKEGHGSGVFQSIISGLSRNTTYYVRAYATNTAGTVYGDEQQFTTLGEEPAITTNPVTYITTNTATSGGIVADDGGVSISNRGIVWCIFPDPTLENNLGSTSDGNGTGDFTSYLTDLTTNTTYYVRAYATNSAGISYGDQVHFTTLPTAETISITEITDFSAKVAGNVVIGGGADVTVRGVVWGTSENPTLENNLGILNSGNGTGSFAIEIGDLNANSFYFVRTFAINSEGVGYGNVMMFKTDVELICGVSTITDIDGNIYNTVLINNQCWMKENLKTTTYRNGNSIEYVGDDYSAWESYVTGAYTIYPHTDIDGLNSNTEVLEAYGSLYNWYAVDTESLCPAGWHVPSRFEWDDLLNYVISQGFPNDDIYNHSGAGNALKSCRKVNSIWGGECNTTKHPRWSLIGNQHGFDEFGFSGLPGGEISYQNYTHLGTHGYWWSSSEGIISKAHFFSLGYSISFVIPGYHYRYAGLSVRCIRNID